MRTPEPVPPPAPVAGEVGATERVIRSGAVPGPAGHVPPGFMRMDLHCHSEASHDCLTPISSFPARLRTRGISVQAITDHNEVWGAQKLKALAEGTDLTVIVGEEVSTAEGEIVGLFLTEKISRGLSPEETVAHIKGQGGLVLLPHGLDPLKRHRLKPQALDRIADSIDIVEAFNARISRPSWNRAAANWADERGLAKSAGSDSHVLKDLGDAWVEAPLRPINGPADLMAALKDGVVMGEWTHPLIALAGKAWDYARRGFRRVPAT